MWVASQTEVTPLAERIREDGTRVRRTEYFGDATRLHDGPQGFLVEHFSPHDVIKPHFHRVRQFQVIVAGGGHLGKRPVPPVSFHYADPYTPYGPIIGSDDGVSFFTLRPNAEVGIFYMPESRDQMTQKAGRNVACQVPDLPLVHAGAAVETLIEPHADGLAAFRLRLGPDARTDGPAPASSGGQYYLVLEGSLHEGGRDLPRRSLLFVEPEEQPALAAGPAGADVLVLQFPVETSKVPLGSEIEATPASRH